MAERKPPVRERHRTECDANPDDAVDEEETFQRDHPRVAFERCPSLHRNHDVGGPDEIEELRDDLLPERLRDRRPHDERDDEEEHTGDVGGEGATLSKRCRELEHRHDEAVR